MTINVFIRYFGGDSYTEIRGISNKTVALGDKAQWTLFRVPLLIGEELGNGKWEVNAVVCLPSYSLLYCLCKMSSSSI